MRDNIMYYPSIVIMIVEALALGFLVWRWREAKMEAEDADKQKQGF